MTTPWNPEATDQDYLAAAGEETMNTGKHDQMVRKEYREALDDGDMELAKQIRLANPDLEAIFEDEDSLG